MQFDKLILWCYYYVKKINKCVSLSSHDGICHSRKNIEHLKLIQQKVKINLKSHGDVKESKILFFSNDNFVHEMPWESWDDPTNQTNQISIICNMKLRRIQKGQKSQSYKKSNCRRAFLRLSMFLCKFCMLHLLLYIHKTFIFSTL